MTKSEINLIKTLLLNKRWETGSLNKEQRKGVISKMIDNNFITPSMQVTPKGHAEYLNNI